MIFAFGTWAGQDMKCPCSDLTGCSYDTKFSVGDWQCPTSKLPSVVVMDVSDALNARIVDSNDDSGRDYLTARVDPTRYQRQICLFHNIIGFKRLGMAFENTFAGRSYAAVADVARVAGEAPHHFEIAKVTTQSGKFMPDDEAQAGKCLQRMIERLVREQDIDAFYLTQQLGSTERSRPRILKILSDAGIPTFSQTGTIVVDEGALLSIATSGFRDVAHYHATKIAQILNGAVPRELPILFEDPAKIAINLETAKKIGFDPPVYILRSADEIVTRTNGSAPPEDATPLSDQADAAGQDLADPECPEMVITTDSPDNATANISAAGSGT
jgi:ABC-type uncharacterized transport system substrate-binding protein